MDKITINKQEWLFPTRWNEITLEEFLKIRELESRKDDLDFFEYISFYINHLTGIPIEDIREVNQSELTNLFNKILSFSEVRLEPSERIYFKHQKKYYVFDEEMTIGQFIDLDGITKNKEWWSVGNDISAILTRPARVKLMSKIKEWLGKDLRRGDFVIEKYDFLSSKSRSELFLRYMPMDLMMFNKCFFLTLRAELGKIIPRYMPLQETTKKSLLNKMNQN